MRFGLGYLAGASVLALGLMGLVLPSHAADLDARAARPYSFAPEIRVGLFAHDPFSPEKGSADLNAEILSPKLWSSSDPIANLLIPRVHLGTTLNFGGRTSHVYAGFTWTYDVTAQVFVEASFGAAIHNGETGLVVPANRNAMGCTPHFREAASIGYRFAPQWSVMATIEHISNGGLCNQNRGLTNAGVRLGYTF